ncbi:MAG: sulfite exporter TauE/SafE family protein [Candidatus Methanoperedens sp.]|nr:sulfite exporter TauE/SafE family protein [Candidatus Methanoperedens sp.]MCZ7369907.1 sulfite exporter TauE/SafE family protein [Candidatus Methanoperedens sp.]
MTKALRHIKKYSPIILILVLFAVLGCIGSSPYKQTTPSELFSNTGAFEGKKVCIEGVVEIHDIPEYFWITNIMVGTVGQNNPGLYRENTLTQVCGTFSNYSIQPDSVRKILSISTEKNVYLSNESLIVQVDFNSTTDGKANLQVSGIKNVFDRALLSETRQVNLKKGDNFFIFDFKTPSCEECSALKPGEYYLNATVSQDGKTYETFKKIMLEREGENVSGATNASAEVISPMQVGTKTLNTTVSVEYFYDPGCQKCAKAAPVIDRVLKSYGDRVNFSKYNVLTDEGLLLAKNYQLPGVPSVVINGKKLISYGDYGGNTSQLEMRLREAIDTAIVLPPTTGISGEKKITLSVPSVLVVGLFAGFNPCLLAILAFIATVTLATTGKRRNVILIVMMFSLGIFVTYLIVGIGLLSILEQSPSLQTTIRSFLVVLIGLLGIWHVYDAWHMRKNTESSFYTPKVFIRLTESVTKKVSLPASFFIGALFSLIKAPCVGAVYFVILDMVRSGKGAGLLYLAAYNLGVVLPVFILGAAIAFGLNPEKVEKFRKERRSAMRLITGVTLIVIALLMYAGII